MKAWAVAILSLCQHGQTLYAGLVMAPTRNEALANGVTAALRLRVDPECPCTVTLTQAAPIGADLIDAAAADLKEEE